jgi:uncharacterized alkaline shock family protein YloU
MNAFNRLVVLTIAVVIMAASVIAILVVSQALPEDWIELRTQELADASVGVKALAIIISVGVVLTMLALLRFQFVRRDYELVIMPGGASVSIGGETTISSRSVAALAEAAGAEVQGVRDIECDVVNRNVGLAIVCHTTVAMGTNLPEFFSEIKSKIEESVEEMTGLPVSQVDVIAQYEPSRFRRLGVK